MNNTEILQLDVWKGDWGLPSVDTDCLQVLAYSKFNGIPIRVNKSGNPFRTPSGHLPVLKHGNNTFTKVEDMIKFFRLQNYNSEYILNGDDCALVMAYETMFKEKLLPALQFIWWIDKKNVDELSRPWYCKALPFPFNFYYPGRYERQTRAFFEIMYPVEDNIGCIENKVYSEAQKCLTLLSTRLGDSEFFFGEQPTVLDAIIYSYLAPLLKAPFPNPALQNHLKACTNLVKYVTHISQRYFEDEWKEYEMHKAQENAQKLRRDSESEFPNKRRNQLLAGLFAILAMAGYAVSTGIVEVPVKDNESSEAAAEYMLDDEDDE